MTPEKANAVYTVLCDLAGASASDRDHFVLLLTKHDPECTEYRFQGLLGFGGKYRPRTNTVDCYMEDETPDRRAIINRTNTYLAAIK